MRGALLVPLLAGALWLPVGSQAQQPPNFGSPEVHADGRVTFRLWAPRAQQVRVTSMEGQQPAPMTKDAQGVWTVTVGPLQPEIYSYTYEIDGAPVIDPRNPEVKVWLQLNSMVEVPGSPPRVHEVQDVPHGTVVMHTYRSKVLGTTRQFYVYTPPGYGDGTAPLPVLYLRHGFGDNASAWTEVGRAHVIADNLIAQKRIRPMLIVMPYGHARSPRLGPPPDRQDNDDAVERELLEDLIPLVESAYRAARDPEQRAIVGLSMGGGQSLKTGLRHLDTFRWVGAFSSSIPQGDLTQAFPALRTEAPQKLRLLWVGIGKGDFLFERNEGFNTWLKHQGFPYRYTVTEGAHDWTVWRRYLAEFLPLLFASAAGETSRR